MSERLKQHSLALVGYLFLGIIFSYPLILNLTTSVLGPMEDNVGWFWYMWWLKWALAEGNSAFFFTDYLFYPLGINFSVNSFGYFKTLLSVPLQYFFDLIVVYNILTLFSYVLAGFGAYLLVRHMVGRAGIGFIGGMIYTLAPYHVWQLDHHLDICSIEMIPFFLLYFIRFFQERKTKDLILAGVCFCLASLGTWYYLMYQIYFLLFFFVYFIYKEKTEAWNALIKTVAMLTGSFIALLPFLYPLIKVKFSGQKFHENPSNFNCVTDLLAAVVPSGKHPLAGWLGLEEFYQKLPCFPWEINVFVGYSVLALAVYGFLKVKNRWTGFLGLSVGTFWILSLGNHLQWKGQLLGESIYLPHFWLVQNIPMVNFMRSPSRFMLLAILILAILYGYGLDHLLKHLSEKGKFRIKSPQYWGLILAGSLIFLEFMPFPNTLLNVEDATQANYLARNLPGADGEYAILELPIMNYYVYNAMLAHRQTRHHKKILGGYPSFLPIGAYDFINKGPLRILRDEPAQANLNYFKSLKPFLAQNRIKYIVLNRYMISDARYTNFLEKSLQQVFSIYGEPNPKIGLYQVY
jgi:hypothetical protein